MASGKDILDSHQPDSISSSYGNNTVKVICLGDSAVGKSKITLLFPNSLVDVVLEDHLHEVFDITRKVTYKNLPKWYKELREYRPEIPCLCAANKIDVDFKVTKKSFNFPKKFGMPFYFVSASDGTNVVKLFKEAIQYAVQYKKNPTDFIDEVMQELQYFESSEFDQEDEGNQPSNQ
ncbi:rab-like protein 2A [Limulus polyphemus]|uniref:Rab-like protein 2A n=1 Tax=Limulus polyphemus TaxID=6850 RepID=A0ABM1T6X9_LIMPO|nr:rab-like protein 2A [Limulus polyphemus]